MDQVTVTYVRNVLNPLETRDIRQMAPLRFVREYVADVCGEGIEGYEIVASVNGCEFLPGMMEEYVVAPGDSLAFCAVPQGGGGGKQIFSLIAMIAIMVAAPYLGGLAGAAYMDLVGGYTIGSMVGAAVSAGVIIGGGLVISALAPKPETPAVEEAQSPTYSWDNVGNSLREGGTLPELFGTCRIVPPVIGSYIDTDGDKHFLNILLAVAGHRVESIDMNSIRLNGSPLSNFAGTGVEVRLGADTQPVMQNFKDTYADSPVQLPMKAFAITNVEATDNVRVTALNHNFANGESVYINDVVGPIGTLVNGNTYTVSEVSGDTFRLSGVNGIGWGAYTSGGYAAKWVVGQTSGPVDEVIFGISFPKGIWYAENDGSFSPIVPKITLEYKRVGSGTWTACTAITTEDTVVANDHWSVGWYSGFGTSGWTEVAAGSTNPNDHIDYEVAYDYPVIGIIDNDNMTEGITYPYIWRWVEQWETIREGTPVGPVIPLRESKQSTLYYAFSTGRLSVRDTYDVRVRRANAFPATNRYCADATFEYFQEVLSDDLSYPGVALVSVRALATDQLSGGMPRVDLKATRGSVWVWTGTQYDPKPSSNPAWACYHLLHRARRLDDGVTYEVDGVPHDRIDYPAFSAWAAYCADVTPPKVAQTCHLYMSQTETLRKKLNTASLLGRGVVVQIGSKFTVLVDKADAMVQKFTFGMGNIVKDSYAEEFIPYDDRANAIEITYFDEDFDYEPTTVEVYAFNFDTTDREVNKAAVSLYGCVDRDMAIQYGTWMLNNNRLLTMVATWEAGIDAVACLPGDVVEVSHDVPQFGFSGRVVETPTNLMTSSERIDQWSNMGSPVATYPGSESYLTEILDDDPAGLEGKNRNITTPANMSTYVFSIYAKAGTLNHITVFIRFNTGNVSGRIFDLTTGEGLPYGAVLGWGSEPGPDGTWRVWVSVQNTNKTFFQAYIYPGAGLGTEVGTIEVGRAQLEVGSIPSTYVPTSGSSLRGIVVDRSLTYSAPCNLVVRHQDDDSIETIPVQSIGGIDNRVVIPASVVKWPAQHANYVFSTVTAGSKKFRVMSIDRESDLTYRIKGIEYDPNVYSDSATVPPIDPPTALEKVTNLIATEVWRSDAGTGLSHVALAWSGFATRWNVWYTRTDRDWYEWIGATTKPSFRMENLPWGVSYTFVVAGDQEGFTQGDSVEITLEGKSSGPGGGVPSLVPQFDDARCSFTDKVYLAWGEIAEPGIAGYEVRRGSDWASGVVMFRGAGTSLVWDSYSEFPTTTTFTFCIKAFDVAGIYCDGEDTITVTVPAMAAPTNVGVVATYGKITITWDAILDPLVTWVEIWRNTTNNFTTSSHVGSVAGDSFVDTQNIVGGLTYYYWLVAKNKYGQYGDLSSDPYVGHSSGAVPKIVAADIADGAIDQIRLADELVVPEVVAALPSLPDAAYPIGKIVYYTADGKLYRNRANVWTAEVSFADVWAQSFDNMVGNARFEGGRTDTWNMGDWTVVQAGGASEWSARAQLKQAYSHMYSIPIRVVGGTSYFVSMDYVFSTDADAAAYTNIWIDIRDKAGNQIGTAATTGLYKVTSWTRAELRFTLPANADYIYLAPYYYSPVTIGQLYVTNFYMKRAVNTELIVDGAIKASQIQTNAIETQHLKAEAVVASKIAVFGRGMALNSDPLLTDPGAWVDEGYPTSFLTVADAPVGSTVMRSLPGNGTGYSYSAIRDVKKIPVNPDKTYRITSRFRGNGDNGNTYHAILLYDKDEVYTTTLLANPGTPVPDTWTQHTSEFGYGTGSPIPAGTKYVCVQIVLNVIATATGYAEACDIRLEERVPGELIVDGSIAAGKIVANSLTAGQIQAGAIGADEIAANIIAAKHMVIADFSNMVMNPTFDGGVADRWTFNGTVNVRAKAYAGVPANCPTDYCLELTESAVTTPVARTELMNAAEGETFYLSVLCASGAGAGAIFHVYALGYDKDGGFFYQAVASRSGASQAWAKIGGMYTAPSNTKTLQFGVQAEGGGGGKWYACQPRMRRSSNSELIVDGAITADKIQAGAIVASKMAITGGAVALNLDPCFTDPSTWETYYPGAPPNIIDITDAPVGTRVLQGRVPPDAAANHYGSEYIPFTPTKAYRISGFARKTVAGADGSSYLGIACYDHAKQWIQSGNLYTTIGLSATITTAWNRFTKVHVAADFPSATRWVQAFCIPGFQATVGYIQICDLRIEEVIPGELIVDGAIEARHITASGITLADLHSGDGAKLAGIADGATKNRVTYSDSPPSNPVDGDIWVDTTGSPDTIKVRVSGAWQDGATVGALTSQINDILNAQLTGQSVNYGKMLHRDPRWKSGFNGAAYYNNNGGSAVTIERVTPPSDSPNYGVSGAYDMKVNYFTATSPYSSPGFGGFSFGDMSRPNMVIVTKIVAKIPVGRTINWASNAIGDGSTSKWLTPTAGTGRYEEYLYYVRCGASGSFATTNYFYISGGADASFSWWVSFATSFDLTDVDGGHDGVTLQNINNGLVLTGGGLTLSSGGSSIKSGNYAVPTGSAEGVGFQVSSAGTIEAYGSGHAIGANMVSRGSTYMVCNGCKVASGYLTTHYAPINSTYFTADGQVHIYYWNGSTWVEFINLGKNSDGIYGDFAMVINTTYSNFGIKIAGGGYGIIADVTGSAALRGSTQNFGATAVRGIDAGTQGNDGYGVYGESTYGVGVAGISNVSPILIQNSGSSNAPTHSARQGTLWVTNKGILYLNTNGISVWTPVSDAIVEASYSDTSAHTIWSHTPKVGGTTAYIVEVVNVATGGAETGDGSYYLREYVVTNPSGTPVNIVNTLRQGTGNLNGNVQPVVGISGGQVYINVQNTTSGYTVKYRVRVKVTEV